MAEGRQLTFVAMTDQQVNAKRILDQVWEEHKDEILEQYEDHTLEEVMRYMKEKYNFTPTKRQYIHRIGEKWGVKKYKQNSSTDSVDDDGETSLTSAKGKRPGRSETKPLDRRSQKVDTPVRRRQSSQGQGLTTFGATQGRTYGSYYSQENIDPFLADMNFQGAKFWYSLLADILYALGDSQSAFQIRARLYQHYPAVGVAVSCGRSAQAETQVHKVRLFIEEAINKSWAEEYSWAKFLFRAQLARNWDQAGERQNAFEQFGDLVDEYIDSSTSTFRRPLTTRGPKLDILAYIYLRNALLRFNNDELNFEHEENLLEVDELIQQFLYQQPAYTGDTLSCLRSCLDWCVDALDRPTRNPTHHTDLLGIPGDPVYKVVCFLWKRWVEGLQQSQTQPPEWSTEAVAQLDIPASELLTLVVCMIMSTPLPDKGISDRRPATFDSIVGDALRRAHALSNANHNPDDLRDRFLSQVWQMADQRMAAREDIVPPSVEWKDFNIIRETLRASMPEGIELPAAHNGYIHPLILEDPIEDDGFAQADSLVLSSSPSGSSNYGLVNFQHGVRY